MKKGLDRLGFRCAAFIVLSLFISMFIFSIPAFADTGPKPSVVITFKGLEQTSVYATLLSKSSGYGPYQAYSGDPSSASYKAGDKDFEIWEKFVAYKDTDGFYFLQHFSVPDDASVYKWTYHPPQEFKILLYFPETDSFAISDTSYERYAFDSYFELDATNLNSAASSPPTFHVEKSYSYGKELLSLGARILITVVLELLIALLYGYRTKKALWLITFTNIATQIVLNLLLNSLNYRFASFTYFLIYLGLEILVFVLEAGIYQFTLGTDNAKPWAGKGRPVEYALVANAFSFIAGFGLAFLIPVVF